MPIRLTRSRWWMPGFLLCFGLVVLAAFAIGGNAGEGAITFGLLAVVAVALWVFGRRSETLRGLSGPGRDERWAMIDVHATAVSGIVLILVVLGGWVYEIAHGRDGNPYTWLAAVAGVVYIVAVAVLRSRS